MPINNGWNLEGNYNLKDILYNVAFFPLPIIWFMLFIIIFNLKDKIYFYFKAIFILLFIISMPITADIFSFPLSKGSSKFTDDYNFAAIIVLTGGIYKDINGNWHPSSNSINRAALGSNLSKKLNIPLIITGGNSIKENPAESLIVSNFIDNKNIILEQKSKNTYESALNLEKILLENNLSKNDNFILITSKFHNLRSALTFKSQNYKIKVYDYSTFDKLNFYKFIPNSKSFNVFNKALYEYYGLIKYLLLGHILI